MILKFLNASLKRRVLLMFMVIGLMLVSDVFVIMYYQGKMDQESKVLSVAYDTKSTIEDLFNTSRKIFRENEFDIKEQALVLTSGVSYQISLLESGGKTSKSNLYLSPVADNSRSLTTSLSNNWSQAKSVLEVMHQAPVRVDSVVKEIIVKEELIDSTYQEVSKEISRAVLVPNPKIKKALSQFLIHKNLLSNNLNELASLTISEYNKHQRKYIIVLSITLIVNLLVVSLFLTLMISGVIAPLGKIGYLTTKVANGEDVEIKYKNPDEIGKIVSSVKSLGNHLRQASDFVHQIGEGNLEATLSGFSDEREKEGSLVHSLIAMQDKLKLVSEEDILRNWIAQGNAKFAEILRVNNNNLEALGSAVLSELIAYTNGNMGCIYVSNKTDYLTQLNLIAFNAFDTKKHYSETLEIGEGLIGQTFVEKKTTHLLEIPEDYAHVKTGTGSSTPNSILIVPLKVNQDVYGILEIASLGEFTKEQIEFIESVGETIASTIYNVKNAEQTKRLLEDSQQLTEQMRAQEEEMRQNMEELSATQEEIARKEQITASTLQAFDQAVATLEFNEDGVVTNANNKFSEISQKSKSNLVGKELRDILNVNTNSLSSMLEEVFTKTTSTNHSLEVNTNQGSILITAYLSPLLSNNAILIGYISTGSVSTDFDGEIVQHLEMLNTTRVVLDTKLEAINNSLCYFEVDSSLIITNHNLNASKEFKNITKGKSIADAVQLEKAGVKDIERSLINTGTYQGLVTLGNNRKILLQIERLST